MFNIKISVPTYKANSWGQLDKQGEVEISAEVDSLSEGYIIMKVQVDELLREASAENRLILNLQELDRQCDRKEKNIQNLNHKINVAREQLRRMENFLQRLGIDPASYSLTISSNPALDASSNDDSEEIVRVEAEVDPIPFDSLAGTNNNPHEF